MHIQDIFAQHPTTFSFEFFPPKTDAASEELFRTVASLQALQPSFVSVTYGAGGSTRELTHDLVVRIQQQTKLTAVAHTLPYDAELVEPFQAGRPLPAGQWAAVTMPVLVMCGTAKESPGLLRHGSAAECPVIDRAHLLADSWP